MLLASSCTPQCKAVCLNSAPGVLEMLVFKPKVSVYTHYLQARVLRGALPTLAFSHLARRAPGVLGRARRVCPP